MLHIATHYVSLLQSIVSKLTINRELHGGGESGVGLERKKKRYPKSPGPSTPLMWGEWYRLVLAELSGWQPESLACCWQRGRNAGSQVCARQWRPTVKQLWCSIQKPRLYCQAATMFKPWPCLPVAPGAPRKVFLKDMESVSVES